MFAENTEYVYQIKFHAKRGLTKVPTKTLLKVLKCDGFILPTKLIEMGLVIFVADYKFVTVEAIK